MPEADGTGRVEAMSTSETARVDTDAAKRELRRTMRERRADVLAASTPDELAERSRRIVEHLLDLPAVATATSIVTYRSLPGEVSTTHLAAWARDAAVRLAVVEPARDAVPPLAPASADVIIVPALALTADGRRLGQGGGWYDRYLAARRPDSLAVGLVFAEFLLADLPQGVHDQRLDCVVSDDGASWRP